MSAAAPKSEEDVRQIIGILKEFPLFDSFPEHLVAELANGSEIVDMPENTQILKQGQMNEHLYFLINGRVGVYVDGGRVSKMQRKGDLLGEMSVITNQPVTATILSESKVTLLRMDSAVSMNVKGPERELYLSILYRIYAMVLAEKLHITNQKAKHFEELTVQLQAAKAELEEANETLEMKVEERTQSLEQQKAELMAGKNRVEELLNNKRVLFRRLKELNAQYLSPLKAFLDEMRKRNPEEPTIDAARTVVFDVQQLLGPLAAQYSSEEAVHGKRVLVADTNKKQQVVAKMALGGTGVVLDVVGSVEEGQARIAETNYDLVIFDAANVELGNMAKAKNPRTDIVLTASDQIPAYLPLLRALTTVPYIVSRDDSDRTFTVKNIVTTVIKLLSHDLFGLEKYLSWGVDIQSRQITGSRQREGLIAEIDAYFGKIGVRRANRDRMRSVVEEMLMNAIYDAPTGQDGSALYNHMSRTEDVALKPEQQGQVRFATDGMLIAISVQDPFGSLKGSTILKYLEHNYAGTTGDLNARQNKGGAGRGLHQIVENSDLVVFNVDPGRITEVIALFNVEVKEKAQQNPSFHLFIKS
jgi:CRP-like cAMP-binding protein